MATLRIATPESHNSKTAGLESPEVPQREAQSEWNHSKLESHKIDSESPILIATHQFVRLLRHDLGIARFMLGRDCLMALFSKHFHPLKLCCNWLFVNIPKWVQSG